MKKNKIFIFFLFLIIKPLFLPGQIINLSNTYDWSELPQVIIRPNGEILVAWTEGAMNETGVILYRTYTKQNGWSGTKIAADSVIPSAFPQLAVDYRGDVHMAYMGSSGLAREIWYRKYSGGTWSGGEKAYSSYRVNSSWPRICVENQKVYVMWTHNNDQVISHQDVWMISKNIDGSWPSQAEKVSNAPNHVSIHSYFDVKNGNVYAAWMDDSHSEGNWNIYYNEKTGGYWKSPVRVHPGWNQYMPAIAADDSGNIHLIYTNKGGPTWYKKKTGGKWSSPKTISTVGTSVTTMICLKYRHGSLHGVWRQYDSDRDCIYYGRGSVSGNWDKPIKVSDGGESEYTFLDVDSAGNIHVVWSDMGPRGYRDIFYTVVGTAGKYPIASFTATPLQGNPPLEVKFDASASYDLDGKIESYQWKFGDGEQGSGKNVTHVYQKEGAFYAELTVTDNDGLTGSMTKKITVGNPPVPSFTAIPTSGSIPLHVDFDASASYDPDGTIESYKWDFGDTKEGTGQITSHVYRKTGVYTVTLYVTDNIGLEDFTTQDITAGPGGPKASFSISSRKGPAPFTVRFDASASKDKNGNIVSYDWNFGDGNTGAGKITSHKYQAPGTYTAVLTVKNDHGATNSASKTIVAYDSTPKASFTASPLRGAGPLKVSFDASKSSDKDGKIVSYEWKFGDGNKATGKKVNHTYERIGTFQATLTVTDNLSLKDSESKEIQVLARPKAAFSFSPKKGLIPLMVTFDASNSSDKDGTIEEYSWGFGDGTAGSGERITHEYNVPGTLTITLSVIDNDNLWDSTTKTIFLYNKPFPPLNVRVTKVINQSPFYVDYINVIKWEKNPKNEADFNIVSYRIYRKEKGAGKESFVLIGEVASDTFRYEDRNLSSEEEMDSYTYAVSAVDDENRSSPL